MHGQINRWKILPPNRIYRAIIEPFEIWKYGNMIIIIMIILAIQIDGRKLWKRNTMKIFSDFFSHII